ncbi:MAG: hypothetical protein K0R84_698 [Clostridia bacterium]|jgi:hypothetical protein|nr:hypothetical protein [Clostridia bacterium]
MLLLVLKKAALAAIFIMHGKFFSKLIAILHMQFIKTSKLFYFAYSIALVSLITLILI